MKPLAQSRPVTSPDIREVRRVMFARFASVALRALGEDDLSFTQLVTLIRLRDAPAGVTVSAVANALERSLSATSRLVDGLVRLAFVQREEDPRDRRVRLLRLSPKGGAFFERLEEGRNDLLGRALRRLTAAEQADVRRAHVLMARAIKGL